MFTNSLFEYYLTVPSLQQVLAVNQPFDHNKESGQRTTFVFARPRPAKVPANWRHQHCFGNPCLATVVIRSRSAFLRKPSLTQSCPSQQNRCPCFRGHPPTTHTHKHMRPSNMLGMIRFLVWTFSHDCILLRTRLQTLANQHRQGPNITPPPTFKTLLTNTSQIVSNNLNNNRAGRT